MACTRRSFVKAVTLGVAAVSALGCSRRADSSVFYTPEAKAEQSVTLTVLGSSGPYFDHSVISDAADAFMEENPEVLLSYDNVEGDLYATAFERRLSTGHLDDVFMLDPAQARMVDRAGKACDLSGLAGAEHFDPFVVEAATDAEGRLVAAPTRVAPFALFCNPGLCRRAGLAVPRTFDDLLTACRDWDGEAPLLEGDAQALGKAFVLGPAVLAAGAGAAETFRAASADSASFSALLDPGLSLMDELAATGAVGLAGARPGREGWADASAFAAGKAPFMVAGSWAARLLLRDFADLSWTVGALPGPDGDSFAVCDLDACVAVNEASEHVGQARAFVEYLLRPEVMVAYCNDESCYRPSAAAAGQDSAHRLPYASLAEQGRLIAGNGLQYPSTVDRGLSAAVTVLASGAGAAQAREAAARSLAGTS